MPLRRLVFSVVFPSGEVQARDEASEPLCGKPAIYRHAPQDGDEGEAGVLCGGTRVLGAFGERVDFERGVVNRRFQRGIEQFGDERHPGDEDQQHFFGKREGQEDEQGEQDAVQAEQFAEACFFDCRPDAVQGVAERLADATQAAFATFVLFGWVVLHGFLLFWAKKNPPGRVGASGVASGGGGCLDFGAEAAFQAGGLVFVNEAFARGAVKCG